MGGRMPGLVHQHGNTLSSRTSNLGGKRRPWYLDNDVYGQRQFIIGKILQAFQRRPMKPEWRHRLPDFVRLLEKGLFKEAASKEEYLDFKTLDRRLQNLLKRARPHSSRNQNVHNKSSVGTMIPTPGLQNGNVSSMTPTPGTDISTVNGAGTSNLVPNTISIGNVPPNSNDVSGLVHGNSLLANDGNSK